MFVFAVEKKFFIKYNLPSKKDTRNENRKDTIMSSTKWEYKKRVGIGHDPQTGELIRKWIYGHSKGEFEANKIEAIQNFKAGHNKTSITWEQYSAEWLTLKRQTIKSKSADNYENVLKNHLQPLNKIELLKLTRSDFQKCINLKWNNKRLCNKDIRTVIRQVIDSAIADNLIDKQIYVGLSYPSIKEIDRQEDTKVWRRPLTIEEIRTLAQLNLREDARTLVFLLNTWGLRPQEACALTPQKIDFKNKIITIDQAIEWGNDNLPKLSGTKNGKVRILTIPDFAVEELKELCLKVKNCNCQFLIQKNNEAVHKSWLQKQKNYIQKQMEQAMGHPCEPGFRLYCFRHNYATRVLYYGAYKSGAISLKECAYIMGHTEEMFLKNYSHLLHEEEKEKAAVALNKFAIKI